MSDVVGLLLRYGYIAVFVVILLENLGLPLPGIALLLVAGGLGAAGSLIRQPAARRSGLTAGRSRR